MSIAWRRGFFRLWLVLSALWFCLGIGLGIERYNSQPYFWFDRLMFWGPGQDVKGYSKLDSDVTVFEELVRDGKLVRSGFDIANINKNLAIYYPPEHSGKWEEPLGTFIKKFVDDHKAKVLTDLWFGGVFFVGASVFVLLIGAAISWALSGFRARS